MREHVRRLLPAVLVSLVLPAFTPGPALAQNSVPSQSGPFHLNARFDDSSLPAAPAVKDEDSQTPAAAPAPAPAAPGGAGFLVYLGATFNNITGSNVDFSSSSAGPGPTGKGTMTDGWTGGFSVGGARAKTIGAESGLFYVRKGTKDASGTKAVLHYFEVPILIRVNGGARSGDGMSFFGFGGIAIDILDASDIIPCQVPVGAAATVTCSGTRAHFVVQGSEAGAEFGGGVETHKFVVEVRAEYGLRNVFVNTTYTGKNLSIGLLFGYRLN